MASFISIPAHADLQFSSALSVRAVYNPDVSSATALVFNIVGTIAVGA